MRPRIGFKKLAAAGAAAVIGIASTIVLTQGRPATASESFGYSGFGHGTYVFTGLVDHGPQVSSVVGCTRRVGLHQDNDLATARVNRQTFARTIRTSVDTHNDHRGDGTSSYASAADIRIGGLLHLVGARTHAVAVNKNGQFHTHAGTTFAGVKIGGVFVPALLKPGPNTRVTVPGLGLVVLNWVNTQKTPQSATTAAAAVLIHSTVRNSYLPKGATVAVLLTKAEVGGPSSAILRGKAYATKAYVAGGLVKSGPTSLQYTCFGTNGKKITVAVAAVTIPGLARVHGLSTTKYGTLHPSGAGVRFSAQVAGATVDAGTGKAKGKVLRVGVVRSYASAVKTNSGEYVLFATSRVLSVHFGGRKIPVPTVPKPHQKITIAGVGVLTFNKIVRRGNHIAVTALEIRVAALKTSVEIARSEAGIVG